MDLRFQLTLAGVVMGIAIAVLWLPPVAFDPERPATDDCEIVPTGRPIHARHLGLTVPSMPQVGDIRAGRRGVLLGAEGAPALGVDVYLTRLHPQHDLIYRAVRTNHLGQFAIEVPPGRYRVQAFHRFHGAVDREIEIPEATHPDIELQAMTVELHLPRGRAAVAVASTLLPFMVAVTR